MITITPEPFDATDSIAAITQYLAELNRRFPGEFGRGENLLLGREELAPPRGLFLLARNKGSVVGCAGLRALDETTAEIKHLWVHPTQRRKGLGRRLLQVLEEATLGTGYAKIVLDTSAHLSEAIALYSGAGYVEIAPYNTNPHAQHWFEKVLATREST